MLPMVLLCDAALVFVSGVFLLPCVTASREYRIVQIPQRQSFSFQVLLVAPILSMEFMTFHFFFKNTRQFKGNRVFHGFNIAVTMAEQRKILSDSSRSNAQLAIQFSSH